MAGTRKLAQIEVQRANMKGKKMGKRDMNALDAALKSKQSKKK